MIGSIDSTSIVLTFPKLRKEDLEQLNLTKKWSGNSWKWIDNGMREIHEPQLTFYRTWSGKFRLRVDFNIAKILHGSNVILPTINEINEGISLVGNNIEHRTGLRCDPFSAQIKKVHYAFNQVYEKHEPKQVIKHYANFTIPRMERNVWNDETAYFRNDSRGIRIYDKLAEIIKKYPIPELIELAEGMIRYEYFFNDTTSAQRFAKRMGFGGSTVREMLSESSINAAIAELKTLLAFDNLNLSQQGGMPFILEKTQNLNKAMSFYGFLEINRCYGREFLMNNGMSKSTYYRKLRECQKLGFCP